MMNAAADDYELELALSISKGDDFSLKLDDDLDYAFAISLQSEFDEESIKILDVSKSNLGQPNSNAKKPLNKIENDYEFALSIQSAFNEELKKNVERSASVTVPSNYQKKGSKTPLSIIDNEWETLDPVPDIHSLFLQFNKDYFWGALAGVEVRWSPRMTLCAGVCCYEGHGGLCSVRLSQPLLKYRPRRDLVETLLHEMIHAYLFVTHNNKDHDAHGPEFLKHMNRINRETGTKISVYHSFHDEVDVHRKHWWKCNGPCQHRRPFFGLVKRAMNRAPSFRDPWWADHQAKCGGTFLKIKEPEDYSKKKAGKRKHDFKESYYDLKEKSFITTKFARSLEGNPTDSSQNIQKYFSPTMFNNKANTENKHFQAKPAGVHVLTTSNPKIGKQISPFSDKGHQLGTGTTPNRNLPNSSPLQGDIFDIVKYSSPNLKSRKQKSGASLQNTNQQGPFGSSQVRPKGNNSITPHYRGSSIAGSSTGSRHRGATTIVLNDKRKPKATSEKQQSEEKPVAYFTGKGHVLGSSSLSEKSQEKTRSPTARQETIEMFFGSVTPKEKPVNKKMAVIFSSDSEDETIANNVSGNSSNRDSELVPCPVCGTLVKNLMINQHLDTCLNSS